MDHYERARISGIAKVVSEYFWIRLVEMEQARVPLPRIAAHSIQGNISLDGIGYSQKLSGSYLIAGCPFSRDQEHSVALGLIDTFLGAARLILGKYVAIEEHYRGVWSVDEQKLTHQTDSYVLSPKPSPELVDLSVSLPHSARLFTLESRTAELINLAARASDTTTRLILLWTAIETQIGDGRARQRLCLDKLKSTTINEEMIRLHKLRSSFLKDGFAVKFSAFDEYCAISILRLSACSDPEQRELLKKAFETRIYERELFPDAEPIHLKTMFED